MGQDREQGSAQREAVRAKQSNNEDVVCQKTCPTRGRKQGAYAINHRFGHLIDKNNTGHGTCSSCDCRPLQDTCDVTVQFDAININWCSFSGNANSVVQGALLEDFSRGLSTEDEWLDHEELCIPCDFNF